MVGFYPPKCSKSIKNQGFWKAAVGGEKICCFFAQTKGKSSVFSVVIRFCGEGGMSSEGGPSEHVAEPLLDEEMLSATDSETEREKQKVNLAVIFFNKVLFFRQECRRVRAETLSLSLTLFEFFTESKEIITIYYHDKSFKGHLKTLLFVF